MRVVNRLLALSLAIGLIVAGLAVVGEALLAYLGREPLLPHRTWSGALEGRDWSDVVVLQVLAVVALVGVVLAALQLIPQRPAALALAEGSEHRVSRIDRRGLQDRMRRLAVADEDVLSATARVRSRRARVTVWTPPDAHTKAVRARVRHALRSDVAALRLRGSMRPTVRVREARERVR